jgi:precorrin-2 dehydrogenase/sirohydrochlorin ferrochelatase
MAMEQLKAVRDMLKGDFSYKVDELNRITSVLIEKSDIKE